MKKIILFFVLVFIFCQSFFSQTTQTFATSGTFTVPADVTTIYVEAWGAGGAGGSAVGTSSPQYRAMGGAGGGGAFQSSTISVTPNQVINYTVAPTTGLNGTSGYLNGGSSTFLSVTALGGNGGESVSSATAGGHIGGIGGSGGIGTTNGGNGGSSVGYAGSTTGTTAGAGGGAGTTANGGDGGPWSTTGGQNNGGAGGTLDGGAGAKGKGSSGGNGNPGTAPGGGGSGAYAAASTTFRNGGAGAEGQIRITYTTALPLNLLAFKLESINNKTNISFSTSSETNNSHFNIEWSRDGKTFDVVGKVNGHGTTRDVQNYSFVHETPVVGVNYYRLTQVDYDGNSITYPIKSITYSAGKRDFAIYPTTTSSDLMIEFTTPVENGRILIYDMAGTMVKSFVLARGIDVLRSNVGDLITGQYMAKYIDGDDVIIKKFNKI